MINQDLKGRGYLLVGGGARGHHCRRYFTNRCSAIDMRCQRGVQLTGEDLLIAVSYQVDLLGRHDDGPAMRLPERDEFRLHECSICQKSAQI